MNVDSYTLQGTRILRRSKKIRVCGRGTITKPERSDASVHLLPDDILKDIFALFVESLDNICTFSRRTPSYSCRILLSSVCRRWRNVIQDMPILWANIVTDLTEDYPPAPLFTLMVERSNPVLVNVDLWGAGDLHESYPHVSPQTNPGGVSSITLINSLKALSPHIQRCRRLKAFIIDSKSAQALAGIPFTSAHSLEELELATQCRQAIDNKIFLSLGGLTALRRLTLLGFGNGPTTIDKAIPILPWSQLLHLDLSYTIPTEEVIWLLQNCTSAVTMRIKAGMEVAYYSGPVICVPNLRALSLSVRGRCVFQSLSRIEAPNLAIFDLKIRYEWSIYAEIDIPFDFLTDEHLAWPSVLNKTSSLQVLLMDDSRLSHQDTLRLVENDYIKRIPIVKLGIRAVERIRARQIQHLLLSDHKMLGWLNTSVSPEHRTFLHGLGLRV
ncbi:hypothetical protein NP233_g1383 [Leucocoprinus birnbaumii]|uniref:F-box domain-containing protein n=1 Tax=Leucocoprinus birnbaumii TaxID=56174 RepID=A0AAD5W2N8_9AGAR|nr:hypothetical protein NP233_g1383 [Leucocoprinus birnbaumii]